MTGARPATATEPATGAALVAALANARAARRPTHARRALAVDSLRDVSSANELLEPFLDGPVGTQDLPALRELQRAVAAVVDALIDGSPPPLEALNALAECQPAVYVLARRPGGELDAELRPKHPSAAAQLVLAAVRALGDIDPARLRRCARPECRLVFYDATRSGTQRWHAERPCGLRERQRRHRRRNANGPPEGGPF